MGCTASRKLRVLDVLHEFFKGHMSHSNFIFRCVSISRTRCVNHLAFVKKSLIFEEFLTFLFLQHIYVWLCHKANILNILKYYEPILVKKVSFYVLTYFLKYLWCFYYEISLNILIQHLWMRQHLYI